MYSFFSSLIQVMFVENSDSSHILTWAYFVKATENQQQQQQKTLNFILKGKKKFSLTCNFIKVGVIEIVEGE